MNAILPTLMAAAALAAGRAAADTSERVPVAVFDFQVSAGVPDRLGAQFARIVAIDLSTLPPAVSVPEARLAEIAPQPRFDAEPIGPNAAARLGRTLGAAALVNGQMIFTKLQTTIVAKLTDAATGRVYGEVVQGAGGASLEALAAELSEKIAALALQIRGLPAVAWRPAALAALPGAVEAVDGAEAPKGADVAMAPGIHHVLVSWARGGASTRASFAVCAEPGARYRVASRDEPDQKVRLWLENAGSGAPATTEVERTWVQGPEVPLVHTATYLMPGPRAGVAAVTDGRAIYIIGGERFPNGHVPMGEILRFDLTSHAFTVLTESVYPRDYFGAALVDGKIYIMGGSSRHFRIRTMQIYDIAGGRLVYGPPMPDPRQAFGTGVVDGRIYVIGGELAPPSSTDEVDIFDVATQTWKEGPPMPLGLTGHAVAVGDRIYFPGGFRGDLKEIRDPTFRQGESSVQVLDAPRGVWGFLRPMSEPMGGSALAALDGRLYLLGAFFDDSRALAYDLDTGASFAFDIGNAGFRNAVAVTADGSIYVVGGLIEGMGASAQINAFSENPNWAKDAPAGRPIFGN